MYVPARARCAFFFTLLLCVIFAHCFCCRCFFVLLLLLCVTLAFVLLVQAGVTVGRRGGIPQLPAVQAGHLRHPPPVGPRRVCVRRRGAPAAGAHAAAVPVERVVPVPRVDRRPRRRHREQRRAVGAAALAVDGRHLHHLDVRCAAHVAGGRPQHGDVQVAGLHEGGIGARGVHAVDRRERHGVRCVVPLADRRERRRRAPLHRARQRRVLVPLRLAEQRVVLGRLPPLLLARLVHDVPRDDCADEQAKRAHQRAQQDHDAVGKPVVGPLQRRAQRDERPAVARDRRRVGRRRRRRRRRRLRRQRHRCVAAGGRHGRGVGGAGSGRLRGDARGGGRGAAVDAALDRGAV
eukprot:Rhum_TRINITY_DN15258_c7_g1::Rhum_TRINITY_DN15258_c7_g1_i1::g.148173::m.148173